MNHFEYRKSLSPTTIPDSLPCSICANDMWESPSYNWVDGNGETVLVLPGLCNGATAQLNDLTYDNPLLA
jgi:hypothetical protein